MTTQDEPRHPKGEGTQKRRTRKDPKDRISKTRHQLIAAGLEITYTARAGTIVLRTENGQPKASIFFVAYTRDDTQDVAARPITFSFNGGPGSSSVWLHLGLLGPRRVVLEQDGVPLPPPCKLVDNECSLLDETDLVFIDPVSTGYSRATQEDKAKEFHAFDKDIESVAELIRLYTTRYKRWASPKFLIGESYGTTRAAGLAGYLQERYGLYLNGVMLISTILNFQSARFDPSNDLPFILFLPTYTATAWHHRQLEDALQKDLRKTLDEVETFAAGEYASALFKGAGLTQAERAAIVGELARFTGLSQEYVDQTDLRIEIHRYTKELLRGQRRTVGRLDSRYTGIDRDAAGEKPEFDPSYAAIQGAYAAALNDHVRVTLKFKSDLPYEVLTDRVQPWDYGQHQNQYVDMASTLRRAMAQNPYLNVFVANGYYDLATPYFATEYTFNHLGLDPALRQNISMRYYEAGHMMYIHDPSLRQLKGDLATFLRASV
jgi:carboxypeptidase C (cathepsin A)